MRERLGHAAAEGPHARRARRVRDGEGVGKARPRGRASVGKITAVSAEAVGPFACKQLRWELTRGKETRARDGLVCRGKSNPDADNERWLEVF